MRNVVGLLLALATASAATGCVSHAGGRGTVIQRTSPTVTDQSDQSDRGGEQPRATDAAINPTVR